MSRVYLDCFRGVTTLCGALAILVGCGGGSSSSGGATSPPVTDVNELVVPEGFKFETTQTITVTVQDTTGAANVKFDLYAYDETGIGKLDFSGVPEGDSNGEGNDTVTITGPQTGLQLLASGAPVAGTYQVQVTLPSYAQKILVKRNRAGSFQSALITISGGAATHAFTQNGALEAEQDTPPIAEANAGDLLYAVNSRSEFYTVSLDDNTTTALADLPFGSIACAIDRVNRRMYVASNRAPYELYYYDLDTQTYVDVGRMQSSFPRMEYNPDDGLLYIAQNQWLYIVDPTNARYLSSIRIRGMSGPVGGGDLARTSTGQMYMTAFSGLYRLDITEGEATATRVSAENFPFSPTSLAMDIDDQTAYMCSNEGNASFIAMSTADGAYRVLSTFNHTVNDLTALPNEGAAFDPTDNDGDGIPNPQDDYPDDPDRAFDNYSPSVFGYGSIGFEDQWPSKGDYDFNDLVVNYRINRVANPQNQVVELRCMFTVQAIGAAFRNGFGFELPIAPNLVASVTGATLSRGIVTNAGNGVEAGQSRAVVVVTDDAHQNLQGAANGFVNVESGAARVEAVDIPIVVTFTQPLDSDTLGTPPWNVFLIVDGVRSKEIHLPDQRPTDLANTALLGTGEDASVPFAGAYYKTATRLPWAIHIIHAFRYPIERTQILTAYNHFATWAQSGGVLYPDWYKDDEGYRNTSSIYVAP